MKLTLGLRILNWLCQFLIKRLIEPTEKKIKRQAKTEHLKNYGSDTKCPGCEEWFSAIGIRSVVNHLSFPHFGSHVKCGDCGTESYWNYEAAPVPLRCDSVGTPIISDAVESSDEQHPEPDTSQLMHDKIIETLGWMHGECIARQRLGEDLAEINTSDLLNRAKVDLKLALIPWARESRR